MDAAAGDAGPAAPQAGRKEWSCRWAGGSCRGEEEDAAGGDDQPSGVGCPGKEAWGGAGGESAGDGDADG